MIIAVMDRPQNGCERRMVVHGHVQDQHRRPAPTKLTSETPFHRPQIPVVLRFVATTDRFNALTTRGIAYFRLSKTQG